MLKLCISALVHDGVAKVDDISAELSVRPWSKVADWQRTNTGWFGSFAGAHSCPEKKILSIELMALFGCAYVRQSRERLIDRDSII